MRLPNVGALVAKVCVFVDDIKRTAWRRVVVASVLYGLVCHWRVYPIIYAPALVLYLAETASMSKKRCVVVVIRMCMHAVYVHSVCMYCFCGA